MSNRGQEIALVARRAGPGRDERERAGSASATAEGEAVNQAARGGSPRQSPERRRCQPGGDGAPPPHGHRGGPPSGSLIVPGGERGPGRIAALLVGSNLAYGLAFRSVFCRWWLDLGFGRSSQGVELIRRRAMPSGAFVPVMHQGRRTLPEISHLIRGHLSQCASVKVLGA